MYAKFAKICLRSFLACAYYKGEGTSIEVLKENTLASADTLHRKRLPVSVPGLRF